MRVLFMTGNGAMFCAGGDPKSFQAAQAAGKSGSGDNEKGASEFAELLKGMNNLPVYVVGLANGSAMGGGFGYLCCCDTVIARKTAFFALSEVKLGVIPATISPYVVAKTLELLGATVVFFAPAHGGQPPPMLHASPMAPVAVPVCALWRRDADALRSATPTLVELRHYRTWAPSDEARPTHLAATLLANSSAFGAHSASSGGSGDVLNGALRLPAAAASFSPLESSRVRLALARFEALLTGGVERVERGLQRDAVLGPELTVNVQHGDVVLVLVPPGAVLGVGDVHGLERVRPLGACGREHVLGHVAQRAASLCEEPHGRARRRVDDATHRRAVGAATV